MKYNVNLPGTIIACLVLFGYFYMLTSVQTKGTVSETVPKVSVTESYLNEDDYKKGYDWATDSELDEKYSCPNNNPSFEEGCFDAIEDMHTRDGLCQDWEIEEYPNSDGITTPDCEPESEY